MKKLCIIFFSLSFFLSFCQTNVYKYQFEVSDYQNPPTFQPTTGKVVYSGSNTSLQSFFSSYTILDFHQLYPTSSRSQNLKIFQIETTSSSLITDMINSFPSMFANYVNVTNNKYELAAYTNDYGNTNPNGNSGADINRKDLDYINVQKAWDFSTGLGVTVGLSDARINTTDADFVDKTTFINPTGTQSQPYQPNLEYWHGTLTGGIMAARGNNNHGSTGVCYNCNIIATSYGDYNNLLLLAQAGVKVINMSWARTGGGINNYEQNIINEIVEDYNVVLVASAGNNICYQTNDEFLYARFNYSTNMFEPQYIGVQISYPASYLGVISVSTVQHVYPAGDTSAVKGTSPFFPVSINVEDSFSQNCNSFDVNNPIGIKFNGYPRYDIKPDGSYQLISPNGIVSSNTSNIYVDLLAPANSIFDFSKFAEENGAIGYLDYGGTSSSAPYVSGTAALMIGVNNCLFPNEVENILKLTTKDVENMPINQEFTGVIGAGSLNAGNAVEFVNEMKKTNGNAVIKNHIFNRFSYNLQNINNNLTIDNVTFKADCIANFTVKNQIHLLPGTNLSPNTNGNIHLTVNPNIDVTCLPIAAKNNSKGITDSKKSENKSKIALSPNPNNGSFEISNINQTIFGTGNVQLRVYDLNGRELHNQTITENEFNNCKINLQGLNQGIYIVKLSSLTHSEDLKFIKK